MDTKGQCLSEIGCSGERDEQAEKENFKAIKILRIILKWGIHLIIDFSKPIERTTPKVNSKINYELWMILMCQHRFINRNRCPLCEWYDNGGY